MAKWELAIAVRDEDDLPSGHKRKKEGDIIAFKPHPWEWGEKEVKNHLIVIVDGLEEEEVRELCKPDKNENNTINKRRYSIPLDILKEGWFTKLRLGNIRNINMSYQPIKANNISIDVSEKVAIFFDKKRESFKYKKRRKI